MVEVHLCWPQVYYLPLVMNTPAGLFADDDEKETAANVMGLLVLWL